MTRLCATALSDCKREEADYKSIIKLSNENTRNLIKLYSFIIKVHKIQTGKVFARELQNFV